jgi:hypothetical protein
LVLYNVQILCFVHYYCTVSLLFQVPLQKDYYNHSPSKINMNRDFVCNFDRQASYVVKREIYNDALEVSEQS